MKWSFACCPSLYLDKLQRTSRTCLHTITHLALATSPIRKINFTAGSCPSIAAVSWKTGVTSPAPTIEQHIPNPRIPRLWRSASCRRIRSALHQRQK